MLALPATYVTEKFINSDQSRIVGGSNLRHNAICRYERFLCKAMTVASSDVLLCCFDECVCDSFRRLDAICDVFAKCIESFDKFFVQRFSSVEPGECCIAKGSCILKLSFSIVILLRQEGENQ